MPPFTPQAWPNLYRDQIGFIRNVEAGILAAEQRTRVPTLVQTTEPTAAELNANWANFFGSGVVVPNYGRTQWFNPDTGQLENVYLPIPDLGGGLSSGAFYDLSHKARNSYFDFIGRAYADISGATGLTVSNIPQTYTDLLIHVIARSTTAAATAAQLFRVNALASAIYSAEHNTITGAAHTSAEAIGATSISVTVPAATSEEWSYCHTTIWLRRYTETARAKNGWMWHNQYNGNPISTRQASFSSILANTVAAITEVNWVPSTAATLELGSVMNVWGIK